MNAASITPLSRSAIMRSAVLSWRLSTTSG